MCTLYILCFPYLCVLDIYYERVFLMFPRMTKSVFSKKAKIVNNDFGELYSRSGVFIY